MKPNTISLTGVGSSTSMLVNTNVTPINLGFVAVVAGTVSSYTIQYSLDDPFSAAGLVNWFPSSISALSATANGNITYPVTALRISIASGTGSVALTVTQAGIV